MKKYSLRNTIIIPLDFNLYEDANFFAGHLHSIIHKYTIDYAKENYILNIYFSVNITEPKIVRLELPIDDNLNDTIYEKLIKLYYNLLYSRKLYWIDNNCKKGFIMCMAMKIYE